MQKITLASKALFDFDKAVLKPEGMQAIDTEIISKLKDVQKLELVLVTGHTDPIGTQAYNQKLSERRADAVRNYLVSKGVAKDKIETLGMGKTQPIPGLVCNQKNMKEKIACFAPDRRVEVEVKGEAIKRSKRSRLTEKPRLARGFLFMVPGAFGRTPLLLSFRQCRPSTCASTPAGSCRSSPPARSRVMRSSSTAAGLPRSCRCAPRTRRSRRARMSGCRDTC